MSLAKNILATLYHILYSNIFYHDYSHHASRGFRSRFVFYIGYLSDSIIRQQNDRIEAHSLPSERERIPNKKLVVKLFITGVTPRATASIE